MILTCEQCHTRYLVPAHAIGADGRAVRCTACQHEWFQEPEDAEAPPEAFEPPPDIEPIPDAVKPIPEGSALPAIPEEILESAAAEPRPRRARPRAAGYAAAASVFFLIAGMLYVGHGTVVKLWPPAAKLYDLAGIETPAPGEGLIFDRVHASAAPGESGGNVLTVEGAIVNLKDHAAGIPPVHVSVLLADGKVFDSWQAGIAERSIGAGKDVSFKTSYPEAPNDAKEITVSFRASESPVPPPVDDGTEETGKNAAPEENAAHDAEQH